MPIDPIYAVFFRAMIRHILGALEKKRLGCGSSGHAELLDDLLVQTPPQ